MTISNRHIKRPRISEAKIRELLRRFSLDLDAHKITLNRYLLIIRKKIVEFCEPLSPFQGEIEVDESYFGTKRVKGKRDRCAYSKTPVFGLLQ
jgi:hypothetical protein